MQSKQYSMFVAERVTVIRVQVNISSVCNIIKI